MHAPSKPKNIRGICPDTVAAEEQKERKKEKK